jgi:MFS family permease
MYGMTLPLVITLFCIGQFFAAANWGTLVAASLDQSPPPYRATCQSFLPMFQAIAGLCAGIVSGTLSERLGLPVAMLVLLVVGNVSALLLLNVARKHYDEDYRHQAALGTFTLDIGT